MEDTEADESIPAEHSKLMSQTDQTMDSIKQSQSAHQTKPNVQPI